MLRSVFASAVGDRLIASSPVGKLALPSAARERVVPLTVEQVRALSEAMPPRARAMVITQAGLGLRVQELLGLQVGDIDFLRRTVRIERQSLQDQTLGPLKTRQSMRTLSLPAVVGDALAEHVRHFPSVSDGSLFVGANGRRYQRSYYNGELLARAVRKAGLPVGTTSHALRHHYASVLLAAGESVVVVAERLGHDNATLVLKTYGHLTPDSENRTGRAIDKAWTTDGQQAASDHG
jgi:integrase